MAPESNKPRIICLTGAGRSGTTLFELLAASCYPGLVTVGETNHIWSRGVVANEPCGCGVRFRSCPFWTKVGEAAFGGWDSDESQQAQELKRLLSRALRRPLRHWPTPGADIKWLIEANQSVLERIYGGILTASSAMVILDASKWPPYSAVVAGLRTGATFDVQLLQIVRSPVGYVDSVQNTKPRVISESGQVEHTEGSSTAYATLRWLYLNSYSDHLRRWGASGDAPAGVLVCYEDLIANPSEVLDQLADFLDLTAVRANPGTVVRRTGPGEWQFPRPHNHGISGNPARFGSSVVTIKAIPIKQRSRVASLALPLWWWRYRMNRRLPSIASESRNE